MEQKLTVKEICFITALAHVRTDEQLAKKIGKPVELVQALFALVTGLKRPESKIKVVPVISFEPEPGLEPAQEPIIENEQPLQKSPKNSKIRRSGTRTKAGSQRDKQVKKAAKKKEVVQVNEKVLQRQKEWKGKNEKVQFKTKSPVDAGMIPFRLNHKTTIYAKPGTNIEELKKRYNIQ